MGIFNNKIQTIVTPSTFIKNELTLTNHDGFNLHAYFKKKKDFTATESGKLMFEKGVKSNLYKCEEILQKQCDEIPDCNVLVGFENGVHKKMYTDGYGMFFGSQIKDKDGESCNIRADVASEIIRKGIIPVQCREAECLASFPNKIETDYKRFAVKQPRKNL